MGKFGPKVDNPDMWAYPSFALHNEQQFVPAMQSRHGDDFSRKYSHLVPLNTNAYEQTKEAEQDDFIFKGLQPKIKLRVL